MTELLRRYGIVIGSYVLLACGCWVLVMIIVPQVTMLYYTTWYIDRVHTGELSREIDQLYGKLDDLDAEIARLERELPTLTPPARNATEQALATARSAQTDIETRLPTLEQAWQDSRTARTYGTRNYDYLLGNTDHRTVFLKTMLASVLVTALALLFCYPIAFYLAQAARPEQTALLLLGLVIPYWVNELLRVFAWQMILSGRGVLNMALSWFGIVDLDAINPPPPNYLGDGGVVVGMIYAYILFMVFPLYNVIETLDKNQLEAARDLGASWWRIHWRIVMPHAKPGIAVGCIMTFMLAAGSYAVPMALSGGRAQWFTQIIYTWTSDTQDMNLGATYAFALLILCIVFILLMMKLFRVRLEDIAK